MTQKMEEIKQIFCFNVKKLREVNNISKIKMAKLLHICVGTLAKIESGILPPRTNYLVLVRICENFHVTPNQIFSADFNPTPQFCEDGHRAKRRYEPSRRDRTKI